MGREATEGALRHETCDGEAISDVPAQLGLQPQLSLTALDSKVGQQKNHPAKPSQTHKRYW